MDKELHQNNPQTEQSSFLALIVRLTWMAFGNLLLIFIAGSIAQQRGGIVLDIIFWAVVAGLILVRYIDITVFHGQTTESEPATLQHWRFYSLMLLLVTGGLWLLAHGATYVM
jgi:hypothetical protein